MLKKILGTAGTKISSALLSFIIISLNANFLGASAVGTIALIILGITVVMLFSSLGGGAALVYLTPRQEIGGLYFSSFIWSVFSAAIVSWLLGRLDWVPAAYTTDLFLLSTLRSWNNNHTTILLGKEKIRTSNLISIAEIMILFLSVIVYYYLLKEKTIAAYIICLYLSYITYFLISAIIIAPWLQKSRISGSGLLSAFRATLRYSFFIQTASFFQLMNYRLSYYFLEFFSGRAAVGVYSVGTRLSESLWIISKSMSTVQYARISNQKDDAYANQLSLQLFRFTLFITTLLTTVLLLLPTDLYVWIFSPEFSLIKMVLIGMAPGIIALACSMAFSGYFSGIGKQQLNMWGSLIGLFFTLGGGLLLIPAYGLKGAAITASVSYTATTLFYMICFVRVSGCSLTAFLPRSSDFKLIRDQLRKMEGKQ